MWWSSLPPSSTLPARDATGSVLNAPSAGQVLTLYWVCSCCVRSVAVRAAGDTIACPYRQKQTALLTVILSAWTVLRTSSKSRWTKRETESTGNEGSSNPDTLRGSETPQS